MVAVDCMSRFLRLQPLKLKYDTSNAEACALEIKLEEPKKSRAQKDKGTELNESFKVLCEKKDLQTYTTEWKSLSERNVRPINKYLEDKWIYLFIDTTKKITQTTRQTRQRTALPL